MRSIRTYLVRGFGEIDRGESGTYEGATEEGLQKACLFPALNNRKPCSLLMMEKDGVNYSE